MAQDMQAVAARSKRVRKPVWHTVLSWKAGEAVSQAQKVAAAVAPAGEKADAYTAAVARAIRGSLEVEIQRLKFRQKDEAGEDQPE